MLRTLLLFTLIFSLAPSVGEVVETVVHRAVEGHWAHSVPHGDEQVGSDEHGCSPMAHLCHCCPTQPARRGEHIELAVNSPLTPNRPLEAPEAAPDVWTEPPIRPPIA